MTSPSEERPDRDLPPRPPAVPPPDPAAQVAGAPPPAGDALARPDEGGLPAGTTTRPGAGEPPAPPARQPYTRIRAAWVGVWAGIVVVVFLIVFIGQNTAPVEISFLWLEGRIPTALALLIAGVGGAIIALAAGAARILQLRRMMRRDIR